MVPKIPFIRKKMTFPLKSGEKHLLQICNNAMKWSLIHFSKNFTVSVENVAFGQKSTMKQISSEKLS